MRWSRSVSHGLGFLFSANDQPFHARYIQPGVSRPDTLTDGPGITAYKFHPSPTRSAVFDPGKTRRINVAHFMTNLIKEAGDGEAGER
jgi:hypothetical protein